MSDLDAVLKELATATERYEASKRATDEAYESVVAKALDALRKGAEPGDVYERVPFTGTYMRTLAREAGIPAGRPGIKTGEKGGARGRHAKRSAKARQILAEGQAAHGDTSEPT